MNSKTVFMLNKVQSMGTIMEPTMESTMGTIMELTMNQEPFMARTMERIKDKLNPNIVDQLLNF